MMDEERLAEIGARADAATAGKMMVEHMTKGLVVDAIAQAAGCVARFAASRWPDPRLRHRRGRGVSRASQRRHRRRVARYHAPMAEFYAWVAVAEAAGATLDANAEAS